MYKKYIIVWRNQYIRDVFIQELKDSEYHFDIINHNLYILENEIDYVENIMNDFNIAYKTS